MPRIKIEIDYSDMTPNKPHPKISIEDIYYTLEDLEEALLSIALATGIPNISQVKILKQGEEENE